MKIDMYEMLQTIVNAIDLINPILKKHHSRTAILAYHLAKEHGMNDEHMTELLIAALLHDVGALTVVDAEALKKLDVEEPQAHAEMGASMLSAFTPFGQVCNIIRHHHVRYEDTKENGMIPEASYILHLADRIEILSNHEEMGLNQKDILWNKIKDMSGTWFAPWAINLFEQVKEREEMWFDLDYLSSSDVFKKIDKTNYAALMAGGEVENLLLTLSKIVDYKCPFTASHSAGVAFVTYQLSKLYGLDEEKSQQMRMAGFLHDIGKIAVPSELLYKGGKLSKEEFNIIKSHPYYTREILKNVSGLQEIVFWASSHHERKDQKGYPAKPSAEKLGLEVEILSYADVFTALCEKRPYREQLPLDRVIHLIESGFSSVLGDRVLKVLKAHAEEIYLGLVDVQKKCDTEYKSSMVEIK